MTSQYASHACKPQRWPTLGLQGKDVDTKVEKQSTSSGVKHIASASSIKQKRLYLVES